MPECEDPNEEGVFKGSEKVIHPEVVDPVNGEVVLERGCKNIDRKPDSKDSRVLPSFSVLGESDDTHQDVYSQLNFCMEWYHL